MLNALQGNILSGHGRHATAHVFLRFDPAQGRAARAFLRRLGARLTSASQQDLFARRFRAAREAGRRPPVTPVFLACVLSHSGYLALGVTAGSIPTNAQFVAGLKARGAALNDPPAPTWDETYRGEIHAMVLLGGDLDSGKRGSSRQIDAEMAAIRAILPPAGVTILGVERGRAYFNGHGDGIEHFGYVDGRSQPLLRQVDIDRESAGTDGIVRWDPAFPLKQVLVRDRAVAEAHAFGSYFVFRKLEQNVRGFKRAEAALSRKLRQIDPSLDPELAGAMIIGRFEDGTPVRLQHGPGMHHPVPNDFDYTGDMVGLKCPFHAHIRKTNPRGDTQRKFNRPLSEERSRIMARRGITYGARTQNRDMEFTDQPTGRVGLLFMAYQADLGQQFEFTQQSWANNDSFLEPDTGIDPVIGQGQGVPHTHRAGWGASAKEVKERFADFVTLKGGEYFFAPALPFFAAL